MASVEEPIAFISRARFRADAKTNIDLAKVGCALAAARCILCVIALLEPNDERSVFSNSVANRSSSLWSFESRKPEWMSANLALS